jgi:hypothetical protein
MVCAGGGGGVRARQLQTNPDRASLLAARGIVNARLEATNCLAERIEPTWICIHQTNGRTSSWDRRHTAVERRWACDPEASYEHRHLRPARDARISMQTTDRGNAIGNERGEVAQQTGRQLPRKDQRQPDRHHAAESGTASEQPTSDGSVCRIVG